MTDHATGSRSVNSIVAAAFGAIYTLVGIAGFFVADNFAGQEGSLLLGLQINHLHNIVHLLIGLALLAASRTLTSARSANLAVGITYVALAVIGPFITGTDLNVVALNAADHGLHLVSGALLAAVALLADKKSRTSA